MINEKMIKKGTNRSKIRELFEYGKILKKTVGEENVFDFTLGNPSAKTPKIINETLIKLLETDGVHLYTSAQGDESARIAIVDTIKNRYGFGYNKDLIYITCGAASGLAITLRALISKKSDCVLALTPYFPEYAVFTENAGAKFKAVNCNKRDFSIDFKDLERKLTKNVQVLIINTPNNPSGAVYSEEDVIKLSKILSDKQKEYGHPIYLLTDEPYREITFDGGVIPFIPKYYDNTIVCYSYSKSLSLSGERIGYLAISEKCENYKDVYSACLGAGRSLGYVCAPSLFQKLIAKCSNELCDMSVYKDNRDILVENLTKFGFNCVNPKGAFYLFLKCPISDANEFSDVAKELGLLLVPSNTFGLNGYVRIATCVPKSVVINSLKAFEKLAKIYNLKVK
ncbi:MAG: pyridoxal phosphate-dependent aminotransferase [Clostridia bacterium]|nr:pyridoxal phosphate-dependent aminotransferase [Clostridia bacterium]